MSTQSERAITVEAQRLGPLPARQSTGRPPASVRRTHLAALSRGARSIVPYAGYAAERLGRAGVVGVALIVFAAAALVTANGPLREQISSDTAALEQATSDAATLDAASSASPEARFETFLKELPTRDDLPALMGQIVTVSAQTGVELEEGKYELVSAADASHIARYRMTFPVTGSYPQVRGFIDHTLVAVPSMSLGGLRMLRKDVGVGLVTAELDFEVFVRTGR